MATRDSGDHKVMMDQSEEGWQRETVQTWRASRGSLIKFTNEKRSFTPSNSIIEDGRDIKTIESESLVYPSSGRCPIRPSVSTTNAVVFCDEVLYQHIIEGNTSIPIPHILSHLTNHLKHLQSDSKPPKRSTCFYQFCSWNHSDVAEIRYLRRRRM